MRGIECSVHGGRLGIGAERSVPRCDDCNVSGFDVALSDDPGVALDVIGSFLRSDPVQNNLVLTLLDAVLSHPESGRYACVLDDHDDVVGVIVQSPLISHPIVTAMSGAAINALVDELAHMWPELSGLFGPADTTARFAGRWAATMGVAAAPVEGQRLYALRSLRPPTNVPGELRPATGADADLVWSWVQGLERDTGVAVATEEAIRLRLDAGLISIWEHQGPRSMAAHTTAVSGVSRVGLVYTAPEHRCHGYGAASTAAVTLTALAAGARQCVLYTQLADPRSNAIYRRLGYEPVSEHTRYQLNFPTIAKSA